MIRTKFMFRRKFGIYLPFEGRFDHLRQDLHQRVIGKSFLLGWVMCSVGQTYSRPPAMYPESSSRFKVA